MILWKMPDRFSNDPNRNSSCKQHSHWKKISIFSCADWPSIYTLFFFEKYVFSCSAHFSIVLFVFCYCWVIWVVCIFWGLGPFLLHHLKRFFSHSVGCLFIFLMVSSAVQKLLSLVRAQWFILFFLTLF